MARRPDPIDRYVGNRIRERRKIVGMTQRELSSSLGISYQQVQKYERGASRISASTLLTLSEALGVQVSFFFEALEKGRSASSRQESDVDVGIDPNILAHSQVLSLVRSFIKIRDNSLRRNLLSLITSVSYYETDT